MTIGVYRSSFFEIREIPFRGMMEQTKEYIRYTRLMYAVRDTIATAKRRT